MTVVPRVPVLVLVGVKLKDQPCQCLTVTLKHIRLYVHVLYDHTSTLFRPPVAK